MEGIISEHSSCIEMQTPLHPPIIAGSDNSYQNRKLCTHAKGWVTVLPLLPGDFANITQVSGRDGLKGTKLISPFGGSWWLFCFKNMGVFPIAHLLRTTKISSHLLYMVNLVKFDTSKCQWFIILFPTPYHPLSFIYSHSQVHFSSEAGTTGRAGIGG